MVLTGKGALFPCVLWRLTCVCDAARVVAHERYYNDTESGKMDISADALRARCVGIVARGVLNVVAFVVVVAALLEFLGA